MWIIKLFELELSVRKIAEHVRLSYPTVLKAVTLIRIDIDSTWRNLKKKHLEFKGRFHDLRSTFASYYVMGGGSLACLMKILGHADYQTVLIYADLAPGALYQDKDLVGFR